MKKIKSYVSLLITISMLMAAFSLNVYAGSSSDAIPSAISETTLPSDGASISLDRTSIPLYKNQTVTLKATVTGSSKKVTWSSADKKIATVNSKGKVTAKNAGTTTITAKANGVSAACTVSVTAPTTVLNQTSCTIYTYDDTTVQLYATVDGPSQKVTWKSSKTSIAKVNSSGLVTAKKAGKTTITAKANGVSAKCTVTVKNVPLDLGGHLNDWYHPDDVRDITKAISNMKKGKNKLYPDLYYTGNHMVIGINQHAKSSGKAKNYFYIKNSGNKDVTLFGLKIGDSKSLAAQKLEDAGYYSSGSKGSYMAGGGFEIKVKFSSKQKVTSYAYYCFPTS